MYTTSFDVRFVTNVEEHRKMVEWANEVSEPLRDSRALTLEKTFLLEINALFEGYRIYYQSLWDVLQDFITKRIHELAPGEVGPTLVDEFMHGPSSVMSSYDRKPDGERLDGKTTLNFRIHVLGDSVLNKVFVFDIVECTVIQCPELEPL